MKNKITPEEFKQEMLKLFDPVDDWEIKTPYHHSYYFMFVHKGTDYCVSMAYRKSSANSYVFSSTNKFLYEGYDLNSLIEKISSITNEKGN